MCLQSRDALTAFVERVYAAEGAFYDLGNAEKALADPVFRNLKNRRLGGVNDFLCRFCLLSRTRHSVAAGMDQRPEQRFIANDANVLRDARPSRESVGERGNVCDTADRLDFLLLRKFF